MSNFKDQDILLIEKYLRNELESDLVKELEQKLGSDAEFKKLYDQEKTVFDYLKSQGNKDLKNYLVQVEKEINQSSLKRPSKSLRLILAIIAAIGLIFGTLLFYNNCNSLTPNKLYAEYFSTYPNDLVSLERSSNDIQPSSLQNAMIAYQKGEFAEAEKLFAQQTNSEDIDRIGFYRAICQIQLGDTQSALNEFNRLSKLDNFEYEEGVRWYFALAYLKASDVENAKLQLQNIIDTNQKYQRTAAQNLLHKLSD